ncbi:SEL1-like repeat protein [Pseudomonas sp. NPDC078416]|uniref:SEL1-like repeat protein n=1 Tax=Pseudomonas sp. NPDC078416 TaxID=3390637 RepID=UPI003CFE8796
MNYYPSAALTLALFLKGCDADDNNTAKFVPEKADYDATFKNLEFKCVYESEKLPPLDADAELLYRYALHLTQVRGPRDFDQAARYYRIAAAHGHYRAATNLQVLLSQGMTAAKRPARETLNLVEDLIARDIPGAYYDMGHYLELGYGVKQDGKAARYYFRRAAEMGNPDAQYYVADMLARIGQGGLAAEFMMRCAMEQGHTKAARRYSISSKAQQRFLEALQGFQSAVKAGDSVTAMTLKHAFDGPRPEQILHYLAQDKDVERSRRYGLIEDFLDRYEHLGAKVPDIDQIIPLPPAKLPEWDETFEWKRKRDAAVPPSPPSEELVARMCEEKGLDPATGWPLGGLK